MSDDVGRVLSFSEIMARKKAGKQQVESKSVPVTPNNSTIKRGGGVAQRGGRGGAVSQRGGRGGAVSQRGGRKRKGSRGLDSGQGPAKVQRAGSTPTVTPTNTTKAPAKPPVRTPKAQKAPGICFQWQQNGHCAKKPCRYSHARGAPSSNPVLRRANTPKVPPQAATSIPSPSLCSILSPAAATTTTIATSNNNNGEIKSNGNGTSVATRLASGANTTSTATKPKPTRKTPTTTAKAIIPLSRIPPATKEQKNAKEPDIVKLEEEMRQRLSKLQLPLSDGKNYESLTISQQDTILAEMEAWVKTRSTAIAH